MGDEIVLMCQVKRLGMMAIGNTMVISKLSFKGIAKGCWQGRVGHGDVAEMASRGGLTCPTSS